jgi:hypothetical protein
VFSAADKLRSVKKVDACSPVTPGRTLNESRLHRDHSSWGASPDKGAVANCTGSVVVLPFFSRSKRLESRYLRA